MTGWIIGLWDEFLTEPITREEERHQPPLFHLADGAPVFEVWFFHSELKRWFVMSASFNVKLQEQGVIYFNGIDDLARAVLSLGGKLPEKFLAAHPAYRPS